MNAHVFDDSQVTWRAIGDFQHLHYQVLALDAENGIAEVLFKFAAGERIVLHRHLAHNYTFVVQGEHRLYRPDGSLKETRKTGTMTVSGPDTEPHSEGGGPDQDVIIKFTILGKGDLYQLLDDQQNEIGKLSFQDLVALKQEADAQTQTA